MLDMQLSANFTKNLRQSPLIPIVYYPPVGVGAGEGHVSGVVFAGHGGVVERVVGRGVRLGQARAQRRSQRAHELQRDRERLPIRDRLQKSLQGSAKGGRQVVRMLQAKPGRNGKQE